MKPKLILKIVLSVLSLISAIAGTFILLLLTIGVMRGMAITDYIPVLQEKIVMSILLILVSLIPIGSFLGLFLYWKQKNSTPTLILMFSALPLGFIWYVVILVAKSSF